MSKARELIEAVVNGYNAQDVVNVVAEAGNPPFVAVRSDESLIDKVSSALKKMGIKYKFMEKSPIPGNSLFTFKSEEDKEKARKAVNDITNKHYAELRKNKGRR